MSRQDQRDDGQQSGYRPLPHPVVPHYRSFSTSSTGQLSSTQQSTSSFGDIYQPSLQRSGGRPSHPPSQTMSSTSQSASGKVAIPALRANKAESSKSSKKGRTSHACDACRKAKAGCSGGQPCARCRTTRSQCVYGDGKRDRERKCAFIVCPMQSVLTLS